LDGKPVLNSAKQPFNPPLMVDIPISVYTINRKEYRNPQQKIDGMIHTINHSAFWGKAKQTLLVEDINATENRQFGTNTKRSWDVSYSLAYNRLTWLNYILDNGTLQIDPSDPEKKKTIEILDDKGSPVTSSYPLDGYGVKLPKGYSPVYEWNGGSPFRFFEEREFTTMYLPNPYL
jgi:hypothetical protein